MLFDQVCAWCDGPFPARENALHPHVCLACLGGADVLTRCARPGHELPTIGPVCAVCEHEAEVRARRIERNAPHLAQLRQIRAQHVADCHQPWPGMNFGKAQFGMMLDACIAELEET